MQCHFTVIGLLLKLFHVFKTYKHTFQGLIDRQAFENAFYLQRILHILTGYYEMWYEYIPL
jgi:hypothetical protein